MVTISKLVYAWIVGETCQNLTFFQEIWDFLTNREGCSCICVQCFCPNFLVFFFFFGLNILHVLQYSVKEFHKWMPSSSGMCIGCLYIAFFDKYLYIAWCLIHGHKMHFCSVYASLTYIFTLIILLAGAPKVLSAVTFVGRLIVIILLEYAYKLYCRQHSKIISVANNRRM